MEERAVDLNCDMGESFGAWRMGDDVAIIPWVTSANVACGFHGGDPRIMDRTVREAKAHGVGVGAHPAFPDLVGFGRRNLAISYDEAVTDVTYQIGALAAFCRRHGVPLQHVKPHGQLNNLALTDATLAEAIVDAIKAWDPALVLISYGGELTRAARQAGLPVAVEAYADRAYHADGRLVSRQVPGAVLTDPDVVVERAVRMVVDQKIPTVDGPDLVVKADTLCIHGDTPGAAGLAQRLRGALERAGVRVQPLAAIMHGRA